MDTKLVAYISLDGTVREAMEFYKSIFGGTLEMQTFADAGFTDNEAAKDRIVHAQLTTDEFTLMGTDCRPEDSAKFTLGDSVSLSLIGSNAEKLTEYFNKLSEGGKVEMPLAKQFWGDVFGACQDKFGINWMVNISKPE